ncbi:MAG: hypothetical protein HDT35_03310 [Clostridiales bacterium]|nr:hypothetical protein [Clostridiales bacterium]
MFEKGKRERRQSEDDRIFNRMLLWLAGAVGVELLLLLLKKVYVDMKWGGIPAGTLLDFFKIYCIAGVVLTVGGIVWAVLNHRMGRPLTLPVAITAAAAGLWLVSMLSRFMWSEGVKILLMLPAGAAVLIVIFFLYQRPFFYNAVLTGGALMAVWLYGRYYLIHPRVIMACFIGGWVILAAAAALAFVLRNNDGKLGRVRVLPPSSNYMMTWITCGVAALAMVLALILGVSTSHYLLYVLAAWLFAQAVFFTVKMM